LAYKETKEGSTQDGQHFRKSLVIGSQSNLPWTPPSWTLFPNKSLSLSLSLSLLLLLSKDSTWRETKEDASSKRTRSTREHVLQRQRKMPEDKHSPYVSLCLTQRCFVSYKGTKEDSTWCAFISLDIPTKKPSARVILVIFSNCNPRTKAAQSQTKPSTTRNLLEGRHFYSKRTHSVVREHVLQ